MTRNVLKRLADESRVNWSYDTIGQSDILSFSGTGNTTYLENRGFLRNDEEKTLIRAFVPNVL